MNQQALLETRRKFENEATLQKLSALSEFSRDIERRERDSGNPASGSDVGRILYVFDENLFEFFMEPSSFEPYVAISHRESWMDDLRRRDKDWESINGQSALIAGEHLFYAKLPLQSPERPIYMTEWHFRELHARLEKRRADFHKMIAALSTHQKFRHEADKKLVDELNADWRALFGFREIRDNSAKANFNAIAKLRQEIQALEEENITAQTWIQRKTKALREPGAAEAVLRSEIAALRSQIANNRVHYDRRRILLGDLEYMRNEGVLPEDITKAYMARFAAEVFAQIGALQVLHQCERISAKDVLPRITPLHRLASPTNENERSALREDIRAWFNRLKEEREAHVLQNQTYTRRGLELVGRYRAELHEYQRQIKAKSNANGGQAADIDVEVELKGLQNLARKLKRRQKKLESESPTMRSDASLQNDARSIAYILWVARCIPAGERIVLITGDSLLFQTYSTWHSKQPQGEPFMLRRVVQYAPVLTLDDVLGAKSQGERGESLFVKAHKASVSQLLSFMPRDPSRREDSSVKFSANGELLQENPDFAAALQQIETGLNEKKGELLEFEKQWRKIERDSIGAHSVYIRRRFDDSFLDNLPSFPDPADEAAAQTLARYYGESLEKISTNGIDLWFPLAQDFIEASGWRKGPGEARAPIALRLKIPGYDVERNRQDPNDLAVLVTRWVVDKNPEAKSALSVATNRALLDRKDIIFAIAATLALKLEHWSDAERFAGLAATSSAARAPDADKEYERHELMYLHALSLRFLLGSLGEARITGSLNKRWLEFLNGAVSLLLQCESYHRNPEGEKRSHKLRIMRAISERAAIRLFYAMWIASARPTSAAARYGDGGFAAEIRARAIAEIQLAVSELRICRGMEPEAEKQVDDYKQENAEFLKGLRHQIFINLASSQVIASILEEDGELPAKVKLSPDEQEKLIERLIELFGVKDFDTMPLIAKIDVLAFRAIYGDEELKQGNLEDIDELVRPPSASSTDFDNMGRSSSSSLKLDRVAIDAIKKKLGI